MSRIPPLPMLDFSCNICGERNTAHPLALGREDRTCAGCMSTVRWRSVIHVLSMGLFGRSLRIADFPDRPDLTGVGLSDWEEYADRLSLKLSYRNTFYDEEPMLDITDPPADLLGTLDFVISTDVFEHVAPPVERAFENSFRLLKPGGILVLTVPFATEGSTKEHYANLHDYEIVEADGRYTVVNWTVDGDQEVFEDPVFHGGPGETLEMRLFSRADVLRNCREAGFGEVGLIREPCLEFGVVWPTPFGQPILARRLPDRQGRRSNNGSPEGEVAGYESRVEYEIEQFRDMVKVHDLPRIFHYWTRNHVSPKLDAIGSGHFARLFVDPIVERCSQDPDKTVGVISIGAGNCDQESRLAATLVGENVENFRIDCLDINGEMLDRGRRMAEELGVGGKLGFIQADINDWDPETGYSVCLGLQSLHHFVELETLFEKVREALSTHGVFLVNDMIGRNGHMRWPEALVYVEHIWHRMPDRYKYNHTTEQSEGEFVNRDCSTSGFEGIRAQDILPLLIEYFHFEVFLAFGNIIDPFVDRVFGPNFDADSDQDRQFIDRVSALDDRLIDEGIVKPTHLIASLRTERVGAVRQYRHWSPEFCVRSPDAVADLGWFEDSQSTGDLQPLSSAARVLPDPQP
jgi:SAM-dependent methyltransferase